MKIYLSGPMTGLPEYNYRAFHAAARQLRSLGHTVVNPAELHPHGWLRRLLHRVLRVLRLVRGNPPAPTWVDYMRADVRALLECDVIATLPGWEQSRGARIEVSIAAELGMRRCTIAEALSANTQGQPRRQRRMTHGTRTHRTTTAHH